MTDYDPGLKINRPRPVSWGEPESEFPRIQGPLPLEYSPRTGGPGGRVIWELLSLKVAIFGIDLQPDPVISGRNFCIFI